LLLGVILDI
jgi:hypothetical protein